MTVRAPGFLSEPKVEFLSAVLEELRSGVLELPRFQRPFVWDETKQLELLRSVQEGLPIGSLMVWRTRAPVTASEWLGDRRLPRSTELTHRYLLDGQQRMATLYAALVPTAPDEALPSRAAYLDMDANDFVFLDPDESETRHLPLSVVLDTIRLRRAGRLFPDEVAEKWIERTESIAAAFKDYKLPTISMATDDIDVAIRTFERVNTQGTQMSGVHMIHALSWSEDFHLLDAMEELRKSHLADIGWDDIDDERILDVVRLRLGFPLDRPLGDNLARGLRKQPGVLQEAVQDIARAAKFLGDNCHVRSPRLLPFRQQLIVLSVAMRKFPAPPPDVAGRLQAWFWVSSLTEWFAGDGAAATARMRESLENIVDVGLGARLHPFGHRVRRPLGPTFNLRNGRSRAMVLLLASLHPLLASGEDVDVDLLLDGDPVEVAWMIPRSPLGVDHASPGNRFLLPGRKVAELRHFLQDPADHPWPAIQHVARSHAIDEDARTMLVRGDYRGFVNARLRELDRREALRLNSDLDVLD